MLKVLVAVAFAGFGGPDEVSTLLWRHVESVLVTPCKNHTHEEEEPCLPRVENKDLPAARILLLPSHPFAVVETGQVWFPRPTQTYFPPI